MKSSYALTLLFMEIEQRGTTSIFFPLIIHVANVSNIIVVVYFGIYHNTMVKGGETVLWYDLLNSKGVVKRSLLVDFTKSCGKRKQCKIRALWNRMAEMSHCW